MSAHAPSGDDVGQLVDSSPIRHDPAALTRRADQDGYLFFRGLLPPEAVRQVRADVLDAIARDGLLDERFPSVDGVLDPDAVARIPSDTLRDDIGVSETNYVHIQQVESMHRLPHHPALLSLYRDLIGGDVFVHPRHIVRAMTSHPAIHPTPPHQDFPLVQGTAQTWTCWFPLGGCSRRQGSLAVLRGSHRQGYLAVEAAQGAGRIGAQLCDVDGTTWLGADFEAGDVLTFPAYTVHRSLAPAERRTIRVSMDVRYQSVDDPIEARALTNHADVDWSTIYAGWSDGAPRHYWDERSLSISPWDDTLIQPSRRIC